MVDGSAPSGFRNGILNQAWHAPQAAQVLAILQTQGTTPNTEINCAFHGAWVIRHLQPVAHLSTVQVTTWALLINHLTHATLPFTISGTPVVETVDANDTQFHWTRGGIHLPGTPLFRSRLWERRSLQSPLPTRVGRVRKPRACARCRWSTEWDLVILMCFNGDIWSRPAISDGPPMDSEWPVGFGQAPVTLRIFTTVPSTAGLAQLATTPLVP